MEKEHLKKEREETGRGKEPEGASLRELRKAVLDSSSLELCSQLFYKIFNAKNAPAVRSDKEIMDLTNLKEVPEPLMMVSGDAWSDWIQYPYELTPHPPVVELWNTRCKPVAVYMHLSETKSVGKEGSVAFIQRKGSSSTAEWFDETMAVVGWNIKQFDAMSPVKTGYSYHQSIREEQLHGWSEKMEPGKYMVYQNKILYAFEIKITDEEAQSIAHTMNQFRKKYRTLPQVYDRENRLFYFVDMYKSQPFIKSHSDQLYTTLSGDDVIDYLMNDGWSRWQ